MSVDDLIRERIVELMGHLPCGDQGAPVIEALRQGLVWVVIRRGQAIRAMGFIVPPVAAGKPPQAGNSGGGA